MESPQMWKMDPTSLYERAIKTASTNMISPDCMTSSCSEHIQPMANSTPALHYASQMQTIRECDRSRYFTKSCLNA